MSRSININSKAETILLRPQRYRIYVLGGFGVDLGLFSISLKHRITGEVVRCRKAFWPVQAFAFGRRAKRIFVVDIPYEAEYEIIFDKPDTIVVRRSNLFVNPFGNDPIDRKQIEIIITEKLGVYPVLK